VEHFCYAGGSCHSGTNSGTSIGKPGRINTPSACKNVFASVTQGKIDG